MCPSNQYCISLPPIYEKHVCLFYYPLATAFVGGWVRVSVTLYLVDTIATTVFAQSLTNFTCKLWMIRGGTLLILGHGVKGQGQLWHSVYKTLWTRVATTVFAQSLSNFTCKLWMMRGEILLILGHGVKGQGQLWHSVYKTF